MGGSGSTSVEPDAGSPHEESTGTMQLGPGDILVAARIDVDDAATGGDVEDAASAVERRVRKRHPEVRHVFLDPTDADEIRE